MAGSVESSNRAGFVPTDLVLVGLLGVWLIVVAAVDIGNFPARAIIGLVAILFAPGYALVSALFPKQNTNTGIFAGIRAEVTGIGGRVTVVERLLLSVVLSVCLVPLLGLGLGLVQTDIQTSASIGAVGITTVGLTLVAVIRRRQARPRERFSPRIGSSVRSLSAQVRQSNSPLVVLLVVGFLVAGAGISVGVLNADRSAEFTEFSLLAEDPETGELVADQYPEELTADEQERIHVEITNNEEKRVQYSVVVLLQSFDGSGQLQAAETLSQFNTTVQPGETIREQQTAQPELTGENLRLTYLLYIGPPPESPSTDNAYRHVHLWVDVPD